MRRHFAGLRLTGMTAPWVLDGPMDGDAFQVYVRNVPAPTFRRGDVVVLDNLPAHKVPGIREAITARRAQLFYLPPYSCYINPIKMAFAKLKALLRQGPALAHNLVDPAVAAPTFVGNPTRHAGCCPVILYANTM